MPVSKPRLAVQRRFDTPSGYGGDRVSAPLNDRPTRWLS